ncbi:Lachrymatory-factor synthase [Thalictrum thalictroides]|uniref:Lachrymatory-factor synthase n=1 Tax=Thalictrum thalictroides TaxID=46969 RepID=A0A7J6WMY6_THATH|nr:Lachrymatory-factor synthase [Thalictrum thalictroides]
MDHDQKTKWECHASVELVPGADQVWPFIADFFGIHKLLPTLDICYQVEGIVGEPGCVRYCARYTGVSDNEAVKWATEKLLSIDNAQRSLSYKIIANNLGYESYMATMKVVPRGSSNKDGCTIEWSFVVEPVEGRTKEDMASHQDYILKTIAKSIEEAHQDDQ